MKKNAFALFLFFVFFSVLHGQDHKVNPLPVCGSSILYKNNDSIRIKMDLNYYQNSLNLKNNTSRISSQNLVYTIPVVVHVIHENGSENISDQQVLTAIDFLNKGFQAKAPYHSAIGNDIGIEFCLARQDMNGLLTTGVNHIQSPYTNVIIEQNNTLLKSLTQWDTEKYLNIWVVKSICSSSAGCSIAGYSTMADARGSIDDGIVVESDYFGTTPENTQVLIHEVGHYLNLYHTFDNGCSNDNCLLDGDKVCDTPPDNKSDPSSPCIHENTCTSDVNDLSTNNPFRNVSSGGLGDQPDMNTNFMDYSDGYCLKNFTAGQKERMRYTVENFRSSLLSSLGCQSPCPAQNQFIADVNIWLNGTKQSDQPPIKIPKDSSIIFKAVISNVGKPYKWVIDGDTQAVVSNDLHYSFQTNGIKIIQLVVFGDMLSCNVTIRKEIVIVCKDSLGVSAALPASEITVGVPVSINNTSVDVSEYEWLINGEKINGPTMGKDFTHSFTTPGRYTVTLKNKSLYCTNEIHTLVHVKPDGTCFKQPSKIFNQWVFKGKGLNFNVDPPLLTTSNADNSEEMSAISDNAGNLLFYYDGYRVYDKAGSAMENGNGLFGHPSTTQGSAIIKSLENDSIYYLFTLAVQAAKDGLSYSVINMNANGGLGKVINKNIPLKGSLTEKLVIVPHPSGQFYWIVVHEWNSDAFYAFKLDISGVHTTPVISNLGTIHKDYTKTDQYGSIGIMRVSNQADKIGLISYDFSRIELFDFDVSSGKLSSPLLIKLATHGEAYSLAFSPDGTKLYTADRVTLDQYDLTDYSEQAIIQSKKIIAEGVFFNVTPAPDDRLYVLGTRGISVIQSPDAKGTACVFDFIPYNFFTGYLGLIGMYTSADNYLNIHGKKTICVNQNYSYKALPVRSGSTYNWKLKNKNTVLQQSNNTTFNLLVNQPETCWLILTESTSCGFVLQDSVIITSKATTLPIVNLKDTTLCPPITNPDAFAKWNLFFEVSDEYESIWQNKITSSKIDVTDTGWYQVKVKNVCGLTTYDSAYVGYYKQPAWTVKEICSDSVVLLDAGEGFESYDWGQGNNKRYFTAYQPGTYTVSKTSSCYSRSLTDEFPVKGISLGNPFPKDTITYCSDQHSLFIQPKDSIQCWTVDSIVQLSILIINNPFSKPTDPPSEISWELIKKSDKKTIYKEDHLTDANYYSFMQKNVSLEVGSYTFNLVSHNVHSIVILPGVYASSDKSEFDTLSFTFEVRPKVSAKPCHQTWNGVDAKHISFTPPKDTCFEVRLFHPDISCIQHKNICTRGMIASDELFASDTIHTCIFPVTVQVPLLFEQVWWNDTLYSNQIFVRNNSNLFVDATGACGSKRDSIYVQGPLLTLNLGIDKSICPEELPMDIKAGNLFSSYIWQDNSSAPLLNITAVGKYWVTTTDTRNCMYSDTIRIYENPFCCEMAERPNLITPNGDDKNETLIFPCMNLGNWTLEIVNRWGEIVYRTTDYKNEWNGENCTDGVYYYSLEREGKKHKGWVEIIR